MYDTERIESIRKQLWECGKNLSDKQILQLDAVYTKLAQKLIHEYVDKLKEDREKKINQGKK